MVIIKVLTKRLEQLRFMKYGVRDINEITGRGGTNYDEVISYANRNIINRNDDDLPIDIWMGNNWMRTYSTQIPYQADGLIYFTDGLAPQVTVNSRCPILWVISGEYAVEETSEEFANLPGNKVILHNHGKK